MIKLLKDFCVEEDGINTVEIVVILAILVGIALIFRDKIFDFVNNLLGSVTDTETDVSPDTIRSEAD